MLQHPYFLVAIKNDVTSIAESLIKNGAYLNAKNRDGYTPLLQAISKNNAKVVELLLKKGAVFHEIFYGSKTPLSIAIGRQNEEIIGILASFGANLNYKKDESPLIHRVIDMNCTKMTKVLVTNGASMEAKDDQNYCPLEKSLSVKELDIAKLIVYNTM